MAKTLADINFLDLLPQSVAQDSQFQAASTALDTQLQAVRSVVQNVLLYARLDELEEAVLDTLAWQLSVDVWSPDLTLAQKRALIRGSIAWHRKKGTPWAVKQLLAYLGYDAEIVSCAEARSTWTAAGGAKLDGRAVDGAWKLVPWRNVTGVDYLEHWAEFSVKFDLAMAERRTWNEEFRWAVNTAKPVRSWPVLCYLLALLVEINVRIETAAYLRKQVRLNYPWCSLRLDGSWQVGYDAWMVTLNGRSLDGSWRLSQMFPGHAAVRIRQCTIAARLEMTKAIERPARYFYCKLSAKDLRLNGCWQVGRNHVLAKGSKRLRAIVELPGLRGVEAVQRTNGRIVYPASPAQLSTLPKVGTWERLDARWQVGAPRRPVRRRLDGSWPLRTPGLRISSTNIVQVSGVCGLFPRLTPDLRLNGSWQVGRKKVEAKGNRRIRAIVELPGLRGVEAVQRTNGRIVYPASPAQLSTLPKVGPRGRLDGSWQVGASRRPVRRRLDGSWQVRTPGLRISNASTIQMSVCCGLFQRLDAERCLDGSWRLGATGPVCRASVTRYAA